MAKEKKKKEKSWTRLYIGALSRYTQSLYRRYTRALVKSITTVRSRAFHKDKQNSRNVRSSSLDNETNSSINRHANGGIRPSPLDALRANCIWRYVKHRLDSQLPNSTLAFDYTPKTSLEHRSARPAPLVLFRHYRRDAVLTSTRSPPKPYFRTPSNGVPW